MADACASLVASCELLQCARVLGERHIICCIVSLCVLEFPLHGRWAQVP